MRGEAEMEARYPNTKIKPWKHQVDCWRLASLMPSFYVAHDMGAGKTKTAVDYATGIGARRILVICPQKIIMQWPKAIRENTPVDYEILALEEIPVKKHARLLEEFVRRCETNHSPYYVIINYDRFWHPPLGPSYNAMNRITDPGLLWKISWDLLIADEAHRIKSPSGKASWAMARLGKLVPRKLFLSGTPMPHSPLDIYAQFRALAPQIYGTSFTAFKTRYCVLGGYENRQIVKFINTDELMRKFYSIAHRVSLEDAVDLPEEQDIVVPCRLSEKAMKIYSQMEALFITQFAPEVANAPKDQDGNPILHTTTASNALVKLLRLSEIASGTLKPDESNRRIVIDSSKIDAAVETISNLPPSEPVVVFARFHSEIDRLKENIAKQTGRTVCEISGRKNELDSWNRELSNTAVVQIQAGGEGIDTFKRAHYCVYFSKGFSLGQYMQSRRRIMRPGQQHNVIYYHIVAENTVDEKIQKAIQKKHEIVHSLLRQLCAEEQQEAALAAAF